MPPLEDSQTSTSGTKDPLPLVVQRPLLSKWATPVLSVALLGGIIWHLRDIDIHSAVPRNPLFWLVLLAYWAAPIISDFIIYRRLWAIPGEGLIALCRKQVGNALLFDLLGETYFYSWARKKVSMEASPFGAIKDVTILSALSGNVLTLILMAAAWPQLHSLNLGATGNAFGASVAVIAVVSILIVVLGGRLFSLARAELWQVAGIHLARVFLTTGLIALAWSLYAPHVELGVWFLLATGQLMLMRLPLFVNADVAFANVVIWFLGKDSEVQQVVAVVAILTLLVNLVAGALLAIGDLVTVNLALEDDVA